MTQQLILNRPLKRSWLDAALRAVRATSDPARRDEILGEALAQEYFGKVAEGKTIRVLKNIWWEPPQHALDFISWGREYAKPVDTRSLHIGAMLAVYPFIGSIYSAVGNIIRQSESVHNQEVVRRVVSEWGDRESVRRAVLMALNTLRSLDVLVGDKNSSEKQLNQRVPVDPDLVPWFTHALILTRRAESVDKNMVGSASELFAIQFVGEPVPAPYPFLESFSEGGSRSVAALRHFPRC